MTPPHHCGLQQEGADDPGRLIGDAAVGALGHVAHDEVGAPDDLLLRWPEYAAPLVETRQDGACSSFDTAMHVYKFME